MTKKPTICIIICTKDRPFDMQRLLKSISQQVRRPDHLIIVDGSDNPIKKIIDDFSAKHADIPTEYVTVRPPSLPKQRNVGISMISEKMDWIGFLDDDLELFPDTLQNIEKNLSYKTVKPLGGMGMVIANNPPHLFSPWRGFFLIDSSHEGKLTKAGCATMLRPTDKIFEVDWLSGGVTFYTREVLKSFHFDEWFAGTGYIEDVDFSFHVAQKFSLIYCGPAKCMHYSHPTSVEKLGKLGTWQITSWWYFVSKVKTFNKLYTLWGMFGVVINNFFIGIFKPSTHRLKKFVGNLKGLYMIINGTVLDKKSFHK